MSSEFKDYNARVEHHVAKTIKILRAVTESNPDINFSKIMDNLVFDMYETTDIISAQLFVLT